MLRALRRSVVLAGLAITMLVGGSLTASADPYWQEVSITTKFHCSPAAAHPISGLSVRTCVVVNANATQSVAIVSNMSTFAVSIEAPNVELWVNGSLSYDRNCLKSTLNPGFVRACFGPTQQRPCGTWVRAEATYIIAGFATAVSSPVRQICP
jgi:hypothetical protein